MKFSVHFLGGVAKFRDYRKPMEFLLPAFADLVGLCESYNPDPETGKPSLHALAGMGGEHVCDFFAPLKSENRMLVIEHTRLVLQMRTREGEDMDKFFVAECRDKMCGSARVLGALFVAEGGEENPRQADCEFWVVVTDIDSHNDEGDVRAYDALREFVLDFLRGELFRPYDRVEITGVNGFGAELENRIPAAGETTL